MKKALTLLMTLVMLMAAAPMAFAASSSPTPPDVVIEKPETVTTESGIELDPEEVTMGSVEMDTLAQDKPAVAETLTTSKESVKQLTDSVKAEPEKKAETVTAYFEAKGESVAKAMDEAIKANPSVQSAADIEPVVIAKPIEVAMTGASLEAAKAEFAEGKTVEMTLPIPEAFETYDLTEDSFLCAELVDEDGNVHIVTFKIVNGKMVGKFPALGYISNFWVGSSTAEEETPEEVKAPQTGSSSLDGVMICGVVLCAAALLFSVKRFRMI